MCFFFVFFFSSRRRHTRWTGDWSSDVCSSDLLAYYGLRLEAVIDTHTHADHRTASVDLKELTNAKVIMHRRAPAPHVNMDVDDDDKIPVGDLQLHVLSTP